MFEKGSLNVIIKVLTTLSCDSYSTTMCISSKIDYSVSSIEQAVFVLTRDGYVRARRGPGGGYKLIKPVANITVGELSHYVADRHHILSRALQLLDDMPLIEFIDYKAAK